MLLTIHQQDIHIHLYEAEDRPEQKVLDEEPEERFFFEGLRR